MMCIKSIGQPFVATVNDQGRQRGRCWRGASKTNLLSFQVLFIDVHWTTHDPSHIVQWYSVLVLFSLNVQIHNSHVKLKLLHIKRKISQVMFSWGVSLFCLEEHCVRNLRGGSLRSETARKLSKKRSGLAWWHPLIINSAGRKWWEVVINIAGLLW